MPSSVFEDEIFTQEDFSNGLFESGTYDNCRFESCQFQACDLSGVRFTDTSFYDCDLSNVMLTEAALQTVRFVRCKLLGIHFSALRTFRLQVEFEECRLDFSSFTGLPLSGARFVKSQLREVDFTNTDLFKAIFDRSDLTNTHFENTNLQQADLQSAFGFQIDPEVNLIRKARFSPAGLPGLLVKYDLEINY